MEMHPCVYRLELCSHLLTRLRNQRTVIIFAILLSTFGYYAAFSVEKIMFFTMMGLPMQSMEIGIAKAEA